MCLDILYLLLLRPDKPVHLQLHAKFSGQLSIVELMGLLPKEKSSNHGFLSNKVKFETLVVICSDLLFWSLGIKSSPSFLFK